jgi:hypothetical protein
MEEHLFCEVFVENSSCNTATEGLVSMNVRKTKSVIFSLLMWTLFKQVKSRPRIYSNERVSLQL